MDNQLSTVAINGCGLRGLSRSSSLRSSFRRHREPIWITNIRQKLIEQLKCLDVRLEVHILMLHELQDFYKRRAEVESEYAHSMEKLVKQTMAKHRNEKQKRETWPDYSTYTVWQTLLSTTQKLGSDHEKLGELYSSQMVPHMQHLTEYIQSVYKKCREVIILSHEELARVLKELHESLKTYQKYHGEFVQAEIKLKTVEDEQKRLNLAMEKPNVILRRKLRNLEKQLEKRQLKHLECNLKAVKARNEYLLCLEAANASIQKYFTDNINELIDAVDFGYHDTLSHAMNFHTSAEDCLISSRKGCLDLINQQIRCLSQLNDKQSFLERFSGPFALPKKFNFEPHLGDKVCHLNVEDTVYDDVLDRIGAIQERLRSLTSNSDETLEAIQRTAVLLLSYVKDADLDLTPHFQDGKKECQASALDQLKNQSEKLEAEEIYFIKFREYQSTSNLIARLQAKYRYMEKALNENSSSIGDQTLRSASMSSIIKKREIRKFMTVRPKLFGGTIEEYIQLTGEEIPLIIRSSVRVINLFGMHHQGIFRIPGSQKEINDYRNQFEKGNDPFIDRMDGKGMDSVAGVLKLYFRELREPMFPSKLFGELASFISNRSFTDPSEVARSIYDIRHLLVSSIAPPIIIIMRYLFSFLNHLSEFSDENMMDPLNLAICLGPTLLPVPSDHDLVQYQGHVTELIKNIIIYQEDIFPRTTDGPTYEKCIIQVNLGFKSKSKNSLFDDDFVLEDFDSGDDIMAREAVALYDFQSRTNRELSFKKGDAITVFDKVSADWWEAVVNGQGGLIPDKYIALLSQDLSVNNERRTNTENKLNAFASSPVSNKDLPVNLMHGTFEETKNPTSSEEGNCFLQLATTCDDGAFFLASPSSTDVKLNVIQSQENRENVLKVDSSLTAVKSGDFSESEKTKTTKQLKDDIDAALADVFSGIRYLSRTSGSPGLQHNLSESEDRHQPDLVNDLPANCPQPNVGDKVVHLRRARTKSKRPASYGAIAHDAFSHLPDNSISNFQSNVTTVYQDTKTDSMVDVEIYKHPSAIPKSHKNSKSPFVVLRSSRHSLAPFTAYSIADKDQPSAQSRKKSELDRSHTLRQDDQKGKMNFPIHANEQFALEKDFQIPTSVDGSCCVQLSDVSCSGKSSTQNLNSHLPKVSRPANVNRDLSERTLTDVTDDYTPSYI